MRYSERGFHHTRVIIALFAYCSTTACAAPLLLDSFEYGSNVAAQASWFPRRGSPAPTMVGAGQLALDRVMKLPCNFSEEPARCYWDRLADYDLRSYTQLALELFVPDPAAISSLTIYLGSGGGYYTKDVVIDRPGWQTLYLPRTEFTADGGPTGWHVIETIRIALWRGASRDTFVALRELRAFVPRIIVVEDRASSDQTGVEILVERFRRHLIESNTSFEVFTDADVERGWLQGTALTILPYNSSLSVEQVGRLEEYVGTGGKLLVYSVLYDRIANLLGMTGTGTIEGSFAGYSFSDSLLTNLPNGVMHHTDSITGAAPNGALNARVIARWKDAAGNATSHAAWLASDNGLFMSETLTREDVETQWPTLLTLIGHYVPEELPAAAEAAFETIGQIGGYATYGEAVDAIRSQARLTPRASLVEAELGKADVLRSQAASELTRERYGEVFWAARDARHHLLEAYYRSQSPWTPEWRGVWEANGTGLVPGNWEDSAETLVQSGMNAVLPNMLTAGIAHYASDVLPRSREYGLYGDQLAACLAAARARSLEVHVWKQNYNLTGATRNFIDSLRAADRLQVAHDGEVIEWLCPSHPENITLEHDAMLEVVTSYRPDGIHLDYIRYPSSRFCYGDGCRRRFEEQTGTPVTAWPDDVLSEGPHYGAYQDWRRAQITNLVAAIAQDARTIAPGIKVSAAVFPDHAHAREHVGQDWVDWIDRGLVDFLCPMNYTGNADLFRILTEEQQTHAAGRIPLYPGIDTTSFSNLRPDGVVRQVLTTRNAGAGGFTIFSLTDTMVNEYLPELAKGTTLSAIDESFLRGDTNTDGRVDVADVISTLNILFRGQMALPCEDAADANDDGGVNIADAIVSLGLIFGPETSLPSPFGACGTDPTPDGITCRFYSPCAETP